MLPCRRRRRGHEAAWGSEKQWLSPAPHRLATAGPLREMVGDWKEYLAAGSPAETAVLVRCHERTGRPLGGEGFVEGLNACRSFFTPRPA